MEPRRLMRRSTPGDGGDDKTADKADEGRVPAGEPARARGSRYHRE